MQRRTFLAGAMVALAAAACQRQPSSDQGAAADGSGAGAAFPDPAATIAPRSRAAEEPILDFDPFVNAQDWQIGSVAVATDGVVANSHATVRARFVNGTTEDEVVYDLVWEGGGWRVDNMRHTGWDLRQIVTSGAAQP